MVLRYHYPPCLGVLAEEDLAPPPAAEETAAEETTEAPV